MFWKTNSYLARQTSSRNHDSFSCFIFQPQFKNSYNQSGWCDGCSGLMPPALRSVDTPLDFFILSFVKKNHAGHDLLWRSSVILRHRWHHKQSCMMSLCLRSRYCRVSVFGYKLCSLCVASNSEVKYCPSRDVVPESCTPSSNMNLWIVFLTQLHCVMEIEDPADIHFWFSLASIWH